MANLKSKDEIVAHLREQMAKAANDYAVELHRQWGIKKGLDDYWIEGAEHPGAAPYQVHCVYYFDLSTLQYVVENNIRREEYEDYMVYVQCLADISDRLPILDFADWHEHPERRIKEESLENIRKLKNLLEEEIERERKKEKKKRKAKNTNAS
jgi:hypothetical protein